MILDSIVLRDFGVYAGRQELVLTPASKTKPIILFGGLNGGGKTTLLDAVQLALYGGRARCSGRGKLAYRDYLREMIHHNADPSEGASVELRFRRSLNGEMHNYHVSRYWHQNAKGIEESIQVFRAGEIDPLLSEHWDEYIESFIPSGIAHLFFFDAEQITELAEGEHAAEILGTAIHTLLGLNIVDRLETDLGVLERRKRTELKPGPQAEQMQKAQQEREHTQQILDQATDEGAAIGTEVGRLTKTLEKCEQEFRQEGGELYLSQADLESQKGRLENDLAATENEIRELAAGVAPLLLIPALLEKTEKQARLEAQTQKLQLLVAVLVERDSELMLKLNKQKLPHRNLAVIEKVLEQDRNQRKRHLGHPCFLHADTTLVAELRHLRSGGLPEVKSKIEQRLEVAGRLEELITRLEQQLARVPAKEAVADLLKRRDHSRQQLQQKKVEQAAHNDKVALLSRQLQAADKTVNSTFGSDIDVQMITEHGRRVLQHSAKVRDTLGKFRVATIRRHAEQMERLVLESFNYLLHKSSLVTGIKIDPSTFTIKLAGASGKELPMDRLSAGERQLLATSLLWGLAKASGRPLPTIIDTPLARLDSSHRRHMLERYFPVASHQVILLSTDEEIDEANLDRLKSHVGRSYHLQFDDTTRSTNVTPGYFWKHETTC